MATQDNIQSDDLSPQVVACAAACTVIAILAVALRLYARHLTTSGFGKDDYAIIVALIVYIVFEVFVGITTKYGVGRHISTIPQPDQFYVEVYSVAAECLNNLLIAAVETSVLLLYHRLFPQKRFRIALWAVGSWVWATKIVFILVTIFQCSPVSSTQNNQGSGQCIEFNKVDIITAAFNVATNVVVLLMPVPLLWRLKMQKRLRIQIIVAFTFGLLTCVVGGVRIKYTHALDSPDISWDVVPLAIACTVESCLFIISSCIPTYVALLTHRTQNSGNRKSISEYRQTRSIFSKKSQDYGISSFVPRSEKWTELNSINNPSETDQVKVTTDIRTTYEPRTDVS